MMKVTNRIPEAQKIVEDIFKNFSLQVPNIIDVKITKANTYYGMIIRRKFQGKNYYSLLISGIFDMLEDKEKAFSYMVETICHEYVHTLWGCWNHKNRFLLWRNKILNKYPCIDICREDRCLNEYFKKLKLPKYTIICKNCGREFYLYRKLKYNLDHYSCSYCKSENLKYKEEGD